MAYVTAANLRKASLAEFAWGLDIPESDVPNDGHITSAITRISAAIDRWCNDSFAPETAATYDIDSAGGVRLYLPRRIRAVTTVSTLDTAGTYTTQSATFWRVHSSLNTAGDTRIQDGGDLDWLEIIPGQLLDSVLNFPSGYDSTVPDGFATGQWVVAPKGVRIVGNWSWATVPAPIQRVCALLAYDHFTPSRADLRRAENWSDGAGGSMNLAMTKPTGIPEADEILASYYRPAGPMVG